MDWNRCYGQERDLFVHLQNVGNDMLTGAVLETTIYLHQDQTSTPVVDTLEWDGALATYEYVTLAAAQVDLPIGHHTASVRLLGSDDYPLNDMTGTSAIAGTTAPGTQITLELLTDDHAADLGWSLMRADQQLPLAGVGAGTYANNTFYTETWNLEEDACYAFSIHTVDQQGLSAPGYFRLLANGVPFSGEAALRHNVETVDFRTDSDVGMPAHQPATSLHIAPNPFDARTSIDLSEMPGPINMTIIDASGRMVESVTLQGGSLGWLERGGLASGCYTLVVRDASDTLHRGTLVLH